MSEHASSSVSSDGLAVKAPDTFLPRSLHRKGRSLLRLIASLLFAFASINVAFVMVYLVDSHVPNDPLMCCEYYPFEEVMLCMFASGGAACISVVLAIPAILTRNLTPLLWLIPLPVAIVSFLNWYDWHGLFEYGKAWH